jgi:GNAT superfamily N-acetyltransferase
MALVYDSEVTAAFRPLDGASLERMLDLSAQLYSREGLASNRERARRAAMELTANPERGRIWLIETDGETAGYMVLTVCFSLEFGGRFGLLDEIFVDEPWRGRGLGTEALQFAADWCRERGMQALRLEVWTGNTSAIRLYQRAGFALEERHLMTRRL